MSLAEFLHLSDQTLA